MNSPLPNSPLVTIPSTITIIGAILTVFGIHSHEWMFLVAGLAFDILDGWTARLLGVETEAGARLDWSCDVMLMGAMVVLLEPLLLVSAIGVISMSVLGGWRFSGRALATGLLILSWSFQ